ncbi:MULTISPECIES: hypothetical protein [unclassified Acinetobacter]|uniref:hypothetical protein n=1 Tax=unclassified Acinetobacter TaxID=196816 RepID=UPI002578C8D4|nr:MULTISPECIES: hypothetical protein [unclassified Acinetobacter]
MEKLNSPLTEDELRKIDQFYEINKSLITLPKNVTNLDTFIKENKIFLEMIKGLSNFEKTKAWMYLYKLVTNQNKNLKGVREENKTRSFYDHISLVITCVIVFLIILPIAYFLVTKEPKKSNYGKCVENGVQYFKDIGSYPRLSDGKHAENVVRERCNRSSVAFGSID